MCCPEISDDNYTGTNFNRPEVPKLKQRCIDEAVYFSQRSFKICFKSAKMQIMLEDELENTRYISKGMMFDSRTDGA